MLNVAKIVPGLDKEADLPVAGEGRTALPFPDPWVLVTALLLLALGLLVARSASSPCKPSRIPS